MFGPPRTPSPPGCAGGPLCAFSGSPVGHPPQHGLTARTPPCIMAGVSRTSTYDLHNKLLDGRLTGILTDGRAEGMSFEDLAYSLRPEGVEVSASTVRRWCQEQGITGPDEAA